MLTNIPQAHRELIWPDESGYAMKLVSFQGQEWWYSETYLEADNEAAAIDAWLLVEPGTFASVLSDFDCMLDDVAEPRLWEQEPYSTMSGVHWFLEKSGLDLFLAQYALRHPAKRADEPAKLPVIVSRVVKADYYLNLLQRRVAAAEGHFRCLGEIERANAVGSWSPFEVAAGMLERDMERSLLAADTSRQLFLLICTIYDELRGLGLEAQQEARYLYCNGMTYKHPEFSYWSTKLHACNTVCKEIHSLFEFGRYCAALRGQEYKGYLL